MNRNQYLNQEHVSDFCEWLAQNLYSFELSHSYTDRSTNNTLVFDNIHAAYIQYNWKGKNFPDNQEILNDMQTGIRNSVLNNQDNEALYFAHQILRWGGVFAHNGPWLTERVNGLVNYFNNQTLNLGGIEAEDNYLNQIDRFNSGTSKIYSLLLDNFIIYDSRVAAALGWIVVKYCQQKELPNVPEGLRFPWAPGKEARNIVIPKLRNPSIGNFTFPRLQAGTTYAKWNIYSSWLLSEVIANGEFGIFPDQNPLRALESALFMIGYDLRTPIEYENIRNQLNPENTVINNQQTYPAQEADNNNVNPDNINIDEMMEDPLLLWGTPAGQAHINLS